MDEIEATYADNRLDVEALQRQLETRVFGVGDRLLYLPVVESTNIVAMQLAQKRPEEGVVVLTDSQTAGKGRLGRRWVDVARRNVLSSIVLRPLFAPHLLVMIASLAVVDTIAETCSIAATIKWPNDVLIKECKVAGILIETSHDSQGRLIAILGIGVNVHGRSKDLQVGAALSSVRLKDERTTDQRQALQTTPAASHTIATTLESECGQRVGRELFIARLLQHIETDYLALQEEALDDSTVASPYGSLSRWIRERWRSSLSTLGRPIQVRQGERLINGIAEDVDDSGELLLRRHSGELVSITWGDIGHSAR